MSADGDVSAPLAGVPDVSARGQGGLLDVVLAPDFAQSRRIYLSYAEPGEDGLAGTSAAYATLGEAGLEDVTVFYRQERVTWNGERFVMLKFRTMPVDAEAASGPVWTRRGERRATPFGALLRRTSLDELPQFLNVLHGEMSLVGPRPERPEFVERFRQEIPGYMQKHLVKAGITGWAQVNDLRGDSDLAQRIQYDIYYIDNWSLWFDLRILVLTLWHILKSHNAR